MVINEKTSKAIMLLIKAKKDYQEDAEDYAWMGRPDKEVEYLKKAAEVTKELDKFRHLFQSKKGVAS